MALQRSESSRDKFTDKFLKALKPKDDLYEFYEIQTKGFGVRVSPRGRKTFFLLADYPSKKSDKENNRTRRAIGHYLDDESGSLARARATAKAWSKLIEDGIDPKAYKAEKREATKVKYKNTFAVVAEDFIARYLKDKRSEKIQAADIRRRFIPVWGDLPITDITLDHVVREIDKIVDAGHKAQAFNSLTEIRTLFSFAVGRRIYGLERSPVEYFNSKMNIGEVTQRKRVFSELEWRAFLTAVDRLEYPYQPLYKLLALTGARLREIAKLHWDEIDLDKKIIKIPASRMKAKEDHEIPITSEIAAILKTIPRFRGGDYLFSVKFGEKAITSFTNTKREIDKLMAEEMKKICEREKIKVPTIEHFVIHDVRRSVRTGMSKGELKIPRYIAELVLAHAVGTKVERAYDHHDYNPEKLTALTTWGRHLASLLNPTPPKNVVRLRA